jgi:MFS family permease
VAPLTLTLLSEAFPAGRRGIALGIWSGISGLGVALGPVVGGAVVNGISWHWIFWLNVPDGLAGCWWRRSPESSPTGWVPAP